MSSVWSLLARHEHHEMPDGEHITGEPLDGIMWAHIIIMSVAFGVVFPIGLVCGLARNRFHVPIQTTGGVLALTGFFLGHAHKGRQFEAGNIHSKFAPWVLFMTAGQVAIGVILKLHIEKGFLAHIRRLLVKIHMVVAVLLPIVSWVQMGFGAITIPGFCHADHLGQCLAHGIMGSSFIAYGYVLTIMLFVGEGWLKRRNKSQEFFDNLIITLWGIVNTFTEHRWGQPWSHGDYQHTSMGIIWWCAGMLGLYLSWDRANNRPQRNHIPALVMIFTGYAMSQHSQHLEVSTQVHFMFGVALMGAGLVRIVEVSFVLKDAAHSGPVIKSWQYLTPFLLILSGMLFMGATEEQMQLLNDIGIMHASYILVISSVACILFLLILFLINLYVQLTAHNTKYLSVATNTGAPGPDTRQSTVPGGIEMQPFLHSAPPHDPESVDMDFELAASDDDADSLAREPHIRHNV
ncbi:Ytp1p [Sugiyamaella lignohabitans]|uniref:Ytp1p n=1 Tax=Sugiyamaella lignohabitans TaxID=796027 RepID=A0A167E3N9_9ASCO|nr:Ytp1p [Sugiyamaella lignohabitans]ANB13599.1 Ytp1p [Sugiyamaella lignohabitans]